MKKVASVDNYDDVLVKDLPQELSEKLFNACKKANTLNYWATFDAIQHRTLKQAKQFIKQELDKHVADVNKDLGIKKADFTEMEGAGFDNLDDAINYAKENAVKGWNETLYVCPNSFGKWVIHYTVEETVGKQPCYVVHYDGSVQGV